MMMGLIAGVGGEREEAGGTEGGACSRTALPEEEVGGTLDG